MSITSKLIPKYRIYKAFNFFNMTPLTTNTTSQNILYTNTSIPVVITKLSAQINIHGWQGGIFYSWYNYILTVLIQRDGNPQKNTYCVPSQATISFNNFATPMYQGSSEEVIYVTSGTVQNNCYNSTSDVYCNANMKSLDELDVEFFPAGLHEGDKLVIQLTIMYNNLLVGTNTTTYDKAILVDGNFGFNVTTIRATGKDLSEEQYTNYMYHQMRNVV